MEVDWDEGFRLGDVIVEPRRERITTDGRTVHLEPKVMQVLVELARRQRTPVTRQHLLDTVWSDAVVGDEVLSRAISLLRSVLGDDRTHPRFIRTLPRLGYELIVAAAPLDGTATGAPTSRVPRWLLPGVGGICALVAAVLWLSLRDARPPPTIAVLPFQAPPDNDVLGALGQSVADDVLALIAASPHLQGVARRSSFALRDPMIDAGTIGDRLGADYIVEGSPSGAGDDMRAVLFLIDTGTGTNVWSERVDAKDPSGLNRLIRERTRSALNRYVGADIPDTHDARSGLDPEAYRTFLEARYQWSLRGEMRIERAIALLRDTIDLAPGFGEAHLALAQALAVAPFYSDAPVLEGFAQARAHLALALEADPGLQAEAEALEGFMRLRSRDWASAQAILERALARDPDSVLANYWYSTLLAYVGEYAPSLEYAKTAARLDPTSAVLNDRLAIAYLWLGDNEAAARQYRIAAELGYLEGTRSKAYLLFLIRTLQLDRLRDAFRDLGLPHGWIELFLGTVADPDLRSEAVAATRRAVAADDIPRELRFGVWVVLGMAREALASFDFDLKSPDVEFLWTTEAAILRREPAFQTVLDRLGLQLPSNPDFQTAPEGGPGAQPDANETVAPSARVRAGRDGNPGGSRQISLLARNF